MIARLVVLATAAGALAVAGVAESVGPALAAVKCGDRTLTLTFTGASLARAKSAATAGKAVGTNVATLKVVKGSSGERGLDIDWFRSDGTASVAPQSPDPVNPNGEYKATITAGEKSGTKNVVTVVTGTDPPCAISGTITQYGVADRVEVTLSKNPVPVTTAVPPSQTVTVKATVKDAGGRPVRDESMAFSVTTVQPPTQPPNGIPAGEATAKSTVTSRPGENPSQLPPNNNQGDGTYTETFTVSQSPSRQTVLASIQGGPSAGKPGSAVVIQYGPAKSAQLTLSPSSIPANGYNASVGTATVLDAVGNPVPDRAVSFVQLGGPSVTFSPGGGKTSSAGQVATKIKGTRLGTAAIAVACGSGSGCSGTQKSLALTTWADRLPTGGALRMATAANTLRSKSGVFRAIVQNDGNFVIYQAGKGALWASRTRGFPGVTAVMQYDGNFVLYSTGKGAIFASRTRGFRDVTAVMQNDGNFVLYAKGVGAIWATGT